MMVLAALVVSYLVGSIPTAFLLVRGVTGIDIRTVGSGNVGATNALRAAGPWVGLVVFLLDGLKGFLSVVCLAPWLVEGASPELRWGCGVAAVLGHNFPVFLNFRGGKGVATTIGVLLAATPGLAAIGLLVWLVLFAIWRYVSLGSLAFALTIPCLQWATHRPSTDLGFGLFLSGLLVIRHRANIGRLLQGRESRATFRKTSRES